MTRTPAHARNLLALLLMLAVAACSPTSSGGPAADTSNSVITPDTAGSSQQAAQQAINDAGLSLGTVTSQSSDEVPIGSVIRTEPRAGTSIPAGSNVNIILSSGSASVTVPVTAGSTLAQAETAIIDAGLAVGNVAGEASTTVPVGQVIRTTPGVGNSVARGANVSIVVSTGPANVSVPDVTNLAEDAAANDIMAATLVIGTVTGESSDVVPFGRVISQQPIGGTMVSASTAVDIVVSTGPANVTVPDVASLSEAAAVAAITDAGLVVGEITTQASVDVAAGGVISQVPSAGTQVSLTTPVDLLLSVGPNPLPVPDIVGLTESQAIAVIANAGLEVGVITRRFSNTRPLGEVIGQATTPGTLVVPDTMLDFEVSLGPPIPVPNVTGLAQAAAEAAIVNAGLAVGNITEQTDFNVAEGDVISQDPSAGINLPEGAPVDLVVSLGPPTVAAPNVVGQSQAQANAAIGSAGLEIGSVVQQTSTSVAAGDVISQDPVAGTIVIVGTDINLVVSSGPPPPVVVPDVASQTQAQAENAITAAGLVVGNLSQDNDNSVPDGSVISQNPSAGASVPAGSAIDLVVSIGPPTDTFSDEFTSDSLGDWTLRHQAEATAAQYTVLDINASTPGVLTIVPTQTPGWFAAGDGPLIFKNLTGDFAVHTRVLADSVSAPGQAPASDFNSAGLMARNASGASGPENYVMLNAGRQDNRVAGGVGSETKTTVDSSSTLFIDAGSNAGDLVLCRIGDQFHSFRWLTSDGSWTATTTASRPDLPATLQVGMVVNAFVAPADIRASFEFIRLLPTPITVNDCTSAAEAP